MNQSALDPVIVHPLLDVMHEVVLPNLESGTCRLVPTGGDKADPCQMDALCAWVLSHLMWNPALDQAKLENEFIASYYGPTAPYQRAYIDGIQNSFACTDGKLDTFQVILLS